MIKVMGTYYMFRAAGVSFDTSVGHLSNTVVYHHCVAPLAFTAWYPVVHYQSLQEVLLFNHPCICSHTAVYHCHMTAIQKKNQSTAFLRDFANNGLFN
jgi:hypothetical protein